MTLSMKQGKNSKNECLLQRRKQEKIQKSLKCYSYTFIPVFSYTLTFNICPSDTCWKIMIDFRSNHASSPSFFVGNLIYLPVILFKLSVYSSP